MSRRAVAVSLLVVNGWLQILDLGTTGLALDLGGQEGNPAVAQMMDRIGVGGWMLLKVLLALLLVGFVLPAVHAAPHFVRMMNRALLPLTLFMTGVVANNAFLLVRAWGQAA